MLTKVTALARALNLVLAIVAGFVAMGNLDVGLLLVVLGLISGITMAADRMLAIGVTVLVLPMVGAALGHIPMIGEQLNAVAGNIALGGAGALGSAIAIGVYGLIKDGLLGFTKAA